MEERKAICDHCRRLMPISKIRFIPKDKNSNVALCVDCRDKKPNVEDKTTKKPVKKVLDKRPEFICDRCKFRFKLNPKSDKGTYCPYCGKDDLVRRYDVNAAQILINSSSLDDR